MTKLTKKVALEVAISALTASNIKEYHEAGSDDVFTVDAVIEKLTTMIQSLDNKANSPKKPTKVQQENEILKQAIVETLEGQPPKTVSEIMTLVDALAGMSNQKVASLVRQMVDADVLVRTKEKRKAYFALAH